jgi:hypothetical protein
MPKKDAKIRKAYRFFCDAERRGRRFSLQDVANAAGWRIGTVESYKSKKWHFILNQTDGDFECNGVLHLSEDAFVRLHAQRVPLVGDLLRPRFSPDVDAFIDKSREASLLAVQTYNNPLLNFRAPGFIVHIVIAFTALFHAVFERDGREFWYKDEEGEPILVDGEYKYWELKKCLNEYYPGQTNAVTENLRLLIGLRNKIEHRFLPAMDISVSGFCQAALMNFEDLLVREFGDYFSLGKSLALALQLTVHSEQLDEVLRDIRANQYEAVKRYIEDFCHPLPDEIVQSSRFSFRAFLIPKIGNHATSSDIAIEFVPYDPKKSRDMDNYERQVALIKERKVQVADQGKYRPSVVIEEIERRTGILLRMYDHTQAWSFYGVRSRDAAPEDCNPKYCQYSEAFGQIIYTKDWIEFLAERVQDPRELERIRQYRE